MRWANRPRPVDGLIAAHGLSSFCLGLAMPYTALYLAGLPGVGAPGVALFYAASGAANLAAALLLTAGVVRLSRVPLGVLGTLLWFAGYLGVFALNAYPEAAAAGAAVGAGQGCFMAAVIPIVNALITPEERRRVFARRYAVLNATLALGSLVSGLLSLVFARGVMPYFFAANAIGILPLTAAILAVRRRLGAAEPTGGAAEESEGGEGAEGTDGGGDRPLRALSLWRITFPAALFQLAAYLLGFSQFEATAPLVTRNLLHLPLFTVSLMLFLNVGVVALGQRPVTRRLENRPEMAGLRIGVGLWVASYLVAGVLALVPADGVRMGGLVVYALLFGLGECAYSCSFHPWLISLVPDSALTRANALVNSMMGVGNFAGPSIGVALALSGSATVVWLSLATGCTAVTVLTGLLARRSVRPVPATTAAGKLT